MQFALPTNAPRHAWSDLKELMNSYYNDDLLQRMLILWIMALLVIYGNNATLVDEGISALRTTVGVSVHSLRWNLGEFQGSQNAF